MPQKNTIKEYVPQSYYHVYFRGANKQRLFLERADYRYFLALFARYLSSKQASNKMGVPYPHFHKEIKLQAYCLMFNHVHLLIYQEDDEQALRRFMSSLMTSYARYFNLKYKRVGSLFESRYKARRIDDDSYLTHITRYIHMNPRRWKTSEVSSLRHAFAEPMPEWLCMDWATDNFASKEDYLNFLEEYQERKDELEEIKDYLANGSN